MSDHLKLAELLEGSSDVVGMSLEKMASMCLLYEYFNNPDLSLVSSPTLIKRASMIIDEDNLALQMGVELGISALTNEEI